MPDLIGSLLMDAETFLAAAGQKGVDYEGEMILLATSAIAGSQTAWTAQRDGFILGFMSNIGSGFAIGVNVDLPSVAGLPADGSITVGLVAWVSATQTNFMQAGMNIPFKAGDIIKARIQAANKLALQLYVGYPKVT